MFKTPADLLCNSCGLCCQVMYNAVPLQGDEKEFFKSKCLRLPCEYSKGGCLIYCNRPSVCTGYKCRLPDRLEWGEIGLIEGLMVVHEARIHLTLIEILLMPYSPEPLKVINDMIVELLYGHGRKAGELIIGYEDGKYRNIPAQALSEMDKLYNLLITHLYNDDDLAEHRIE